MHPATSTSTSPTLYEQVIGCCLPRDQSGGAEPLSRSIRTSNEATGGQPLLDCSPKTAGGTSNSRCARFLSNVRTFFTNLWHYKLDVGLGLLSIAGGLIIIFVVDLPTVFGSEALTKGLPFFMIGAGTTKILGAFRNAYVDTCNSGCSINSHFDQYRYVPPKDEVRKDEQNKNAGPDNRDEDSNRIDQRDPLLNVSPKPYKEKERPKELSGVSNDQSNTESSSSSDFSSNSGSFGIPIFSSSSSASSDPAPASSSSISSTSSVTQPSGSDQQPPLSIIKPVLDQTTNEVV